MICHRRLNVLVEAEHILYALTIRRFYTVRLRILRHVQYALRTLFETFHATTALTSGFHKPASREIEIDSSDRERVRLSGSNSVHRESACTLLYQK